MKTCNDAPVGYTDHPPVGEWQPWNGGVCPVHPLCVVEYVMRAEQAGPDAADQLDWEHSGDSWDIVAYRIVEEYKPEPEKVAREWWIGGNELFKTKHQAEKEGWDSPIHVMEVTQ